MVEERTVVATTRARLRLTLYHDEQKRLDPPLYTVRAIFNVADVNDDASEYDRLLQVFPCAEVIDMVTLEELEPRVVSYSTPTPRLLQLTWLDPGTIGFNNQVFRRAMYKAATLWLSVEVASPLKPHFPVLLKPQRVNENASCLAVAHFAFQYLSNTGTNNITANSVSIDRPHHQTPQGSPELPMTNTPKREFAVGLA